MSELYHYGVKGMKWGVRRYQNKDGSLTPAGKKKYSEKTDSESSNNRTELVRRLANREFKADVKEQKAYAKYSKYVESLKRPTTWYDKDGKLTKEAKDYYDKEEKAYEKYESASKKSYQEKKQEEKDLREKIFLSSDVKQSVKDAKKVYEEIAKVENEMLGRNSQAYKNAEKEYKKKNKDDIDKNGYDNYGFDHYYWPYSTERKQAMSECNKKTEHLRNRYTDLITKVGKDVTNGFSDQKISGNPYYESYAEWGKSTVDDIIRFDRIEL